MAYVKKNRIQAKKVAMLVSAGIVCAAAVFYWAYLSNRDQVLISFYRNSEGVVKAVNENTVEILRAKAAMRKGEVLDAGKAEMVRIPAELVPRGAVTSLSRIENMRLSKDIAEKEFLNERDLTPSQLVYEEGDRLMEHNFPEGTVPDAVADGSSIDIKLFKKGEEDPVVISKVVVVSRKANLLAFYMNATEQEYIKEAAAEGMLFSVRYIDESQAASEVTYSPSYDKEKIQ